MQDKIWDLTRLSPPVERESTRERGGRGEGERESGGEGEGARERVRERER